MNRGSPGSSMARASVLHKQQQRPSRRPHAAFRYAGPHTPVPRNAGTAHRAIPAPYYHSGRHPPHKKTYRLKNNRYCGRARRQRRALASARSLSNEACPSERSCADQRTECRSRQTGFSASDPRHRDTNKARKQQDIIAPNRPTGIYRTVSFRCYLIAIFCRKRFLF